MSHYDEQQEKYEKEWHHANNVVIGPNTTRRSVGPAGSHYDKGIQPVTYIEANGLDFFQGNVVKYVTRFRDKNGVEDLQKAKYYLELLIDREDT